MVTNLLLRSENSTLAVIQAAKKLYKGDRLLGAGLELPNQLVRKLGYFFDTTLELVLLY